MYGCFNQDVNALPFKERGPVVQRVSRGGVNLTDGAVGAAGEQTNE